MRFEAGYILLDTEGLAQYRVLAHQNTHPLYVNIAKENRQRAISWMSILSEALIKTKKTVSKNGRNDVKINDTRERRTDVFFKSIIETQ